jgi:hypothetical protein
VSEPIIGPPILPLAVVLATFAREDGVLTRPEAKAIVEAVEKNGVSSMDWTLIERLASDIERPAYCTAAEGEHCEDPFVYADGAKDILDSFFRRHSRL